MASANKGLFVWYEHLTKDAKAAIAFYAEVVGWKTEPFAQGGDYIMWVGSQGPLGGVMDRARRATDARPACGRTARRSRGGTRDRKMSGV